MEPGCLVRALFDYKGTSKAELAFSFGDVFSFVEMDPRGWAKGEKDGVRGWFPVSFVEVVESEPMVTRRSRGMTVCAPDFSTPSSPYEELFGGSYTVEYGSGGDGYGDDDEEYEEEEEEEGDIYDPMESLAEVEEALFAADEALAQPPCRSQEAAASFASQPAPGPPAASEGEEDDLPGLEEVPVPPKKHVFASTVGASAIRAARPQPPPRRQLAASASLQKQRPTSTSSRQSVSVRNSPEPPPRRPYRHSVAVPGSSARASPERHRSGSNPQSTEQGTTGGQARGASPMVAKRLAACFGAPPIEKRAVELFDKERAELLKPKSEDCDASSILEKKEETTVNLNFFLQNRLNIHSDGHEQGKKKSRLLRLLGKKEKRLVFGVPLQDLKRDAADVCSVPYVIIQCCQFLEQKGMSTKGLFRVPGNQDRMQKLIHDFKSPTDLVDQSRFPDPHTVASVLKAFFHQLPEPLIPFEFFDEMLAVSEEEKKAKKKIQRFQETISKLPASHNIVLIYLLKFLHNVSQKSKSNQMHARNLGIVWGPTLLRPATKDPIVLMSCNTKCTDVVECWIESYYKIFEPNAKRKK